MIVCVGPIFLDRIVKIDSFPEKPIKLVAKGLEKRLGGPAAVASFAVNILGESSELVSRFGDDTAADFLQSELNDYNINYDKSITVNGALSSQSHIFEDSHGERMLAVFNEKKLLNEYNKIKFFDHQGSHWAPHLIHKDYWKRIGGFSEEFNPGIGSDPDLNMKLWKTGVRIFKGLSNFRVYHFGSVVLRKKANFVRNKGSKTFLLKWGISPTFFVKFYLRGGSFENGIINCIKFDGPLKEPIKNIFYFFYLIISKLKLIYLKIFKF